MSKYMPDQQILKTLIEYNELTGETRWLTRAIELFTAGKYSAEWSQCKWNTRYAGQIAFPNTDNEGYYFGSIFHRKYRAHRVIWKWMTNDDVYMIDHVNGDRTDNRWLNLRSTDDVANARNSAMTSKNKSGHLGVRFNEQAQRWVAYIGDGKHVHLGSYTTKEQALSVRRKAEVRLGYHPNHGRIR